MDKFTKDCEQFFFACGVVLGGIFVAVPWVIGAVVIVQWATSKGAN